MSANIVNMDQKPNRPNSENSRRVNQRSSWRNGQPNRRRNQPATKATLSLLATLAMIGSTLAGITIAALATATPAAATPTAGNNQYARAEITFEAPAPTSGATPSLQLAFTSSHSSCSNVSSIRLLANGTSRTRQIVTNHDPTPSDITNSGDLTCNYNIIITSNLENCSLTISRGTGTPALTGTNIALRGGDSPNFSTGVGNFDGLTAENTITITSASCTQPPPTQTPGLVQLRNLESTERYRTTFVPFGSCSPTNNPQQIIAQQQWSLAVLDFKCNWQLNVAPLDNIAAVGCRVDALLYFNDGTVEVDADGEIFLHQVGGLAASGGKQLNRIDLSFSTASPLTGACQELIRLTVIPRLVASVDANLFGGAEVSFTVEPLDNTQNRDCTQKTQFEGSSLNPATIDLVKSPAGTTATCAYKLTADARSDALQLAENQFATRQFDTRGATQVAVAFIYAERRIPVQVALQVFAPGGSVFRTDQIIELQVTVPGACGNDTSFLGGVSGRIGVSYGMFVLPGVTYAIGPNARNVNKDASYDLPPYVVINGERTHCTVRVTEISAFENCAPVNVQRDEAGRAYAEAAWTTNANRITATIQYNCASYGPGIGSGGTSGNTGSGSAGQTTLTRGWLALPFNGTSGTSPQAFVAELDNAVASVWVWNAQQRAWQGWSASGGSQGLTSLNNGDTVMVYVPSSQVVTYRPFDLLTPPATSGRLTLPPGYSFQVFGGDTPRSLQGLLGAQASVIPVIYRWNNRDQQWNYYLASGRRSDVSVPWFDVINPGDAVFMFNAGSAAATIPWS